MTRPLPAFVLAMLLLFCPTASEAEPTASPANMNRPVASQALFTRVRQDASDFIVQIETVGGAQPLNRAALRMQHEKDTDKSPPSPFVELPGSSFVLADGPTTGIIYSADGLILTSSFNFVRAPSIVTVRLPDERLLVADILGRDHVRKLTLLKIDAQSLPTPEWTPREQIRPGQWAIALGRGFGGGMTSVSVGIVSATGRMAGNAIQTDAKLSPANYGGPLMDSTGRVLGICVPMAQRPGELAGVELYDSGVGFAIPGWRVREIVEHLQAGQSFDRGWLGISVDPRTRHGVRILATADPSPLRRAGAREGDFIVAINGKPIKHFGQLTEALNMIPAGQSVHVRLLRGAEYVDVEAVLARSGELGPLPETAEPFDPSQPANPPDTKRPND